MTTKFTNELFLNAFLYQLSTCILNCPLGEEGAQLLQRWVSLGFLDPRTVDKLRTCVVLARADVAVADVAVRPVAVDQADVVRVAALGAFHDEAFLAENAVILIAQFAVHDVRRQLLALISVEIDHGGACTCLGFVTQALGGLFSGLGELWRATAATAAAAAAATTTAAVGGGAVDRGQLMLHGIDDGLLGIDVQLQGLVLHTVFVLEGFESCFNI